MGLEPPLGNLVPNCIFSAMFCARFHQKFKTLLFNTGLRIDTFFEVSRTYLQLVLRKKIPTVDNNRVSRRY